MTKFSKQHKTDRQIRKEIEERSEDGEPDTEYEDFNDENHPLFGRKRNPRAWRIVDENRRLRGLLRI